MGLNKDWIITLQNVLNNENIPFDLKNEGYFHLLFITHTKVILNLLPLHQGFNPDDLIALQEKYQAQQFQVLHLWEDVWQTRQAQVLGRIRSVLGMNMRIHGRSTLVERIAKEDAAIFLDKYHLQGNVNARYCFGLIYQHELVALATFSNKRRMKLKGNDFNSAELIRFATKQGITVVGGMTKLIKHYFDHYKPDDLMSYADRDWSIGNAYLTSGFKLIGVTAPIYLNVDPVTLQRYRKNSVDSSVSIQGFIEIFNTGNLKYILDFNDK